MGKQLRIPHSAQLLRSFHEQCLGCARIPLLEKDAGHVVAKLRAHPDILERLVQAEAALRIGQGSVGLAGLLE